MQTEALLILNRAHRRHLFEVLEKSGAAHVRALRQRGNIRSPAEFRAERMNGLRYFVHFASGTHELPNRRSLRPFQEMVKYFFEDQWPEHTRFNQPLTSVNKCQPAISQLFPS